MPSNPVGFLIPVAVTGKIRIGKNLDGGYVIYGKTLNNTDLLLTYGVGWDSHFEEEFHKKTGRPVLMFDPTMFPQNGWLDSERFSAMVFDLRFKKAFRYWRRVSVWKNKLSQLKTKGIQFVNEGVAQHDDGIYVSMATHMKRYNLADKRILLKIDIEGNEYAIMEDDAFYSHLGNVNQIIMEWHDLKNKLLTLRKILHKLKNAGFEIVHIHSNNYGDTFRLPHPDDPESDIMVPDVLEMALVRKSEIAPEDYYNGPVTYPVKDLDYPNDPRQEDHQLDFAKTGN